MGFFRSGVLLCGYKALKVGMTKAQVLELLGEPTGCRVNSGVETMTWKSSEFRGFVRGGTMVRSIIVDLKDGIVTGFDSENLDRPRL